MAGTMYSVTLTGKVRAGRDAPAVWARVAQLLRLDATAFRERVLERLPVTLKAVAYEEARRQQEALASSGADVMLLDEDKSPRLWIRIDRATRGPLSMTYARRVLREGGLPGSTHACLQDGREWHSLEMLVKQHAPPPAPPVPARTNAADTAAPERIRGEWPGWVLGAIVVAASLGLVGLLVALIGVPAWRDHVIREQVVQGAHRADRPRAAVAEYLRAHGMPPADNAAAGLATASSLRGPYVASVTVDHGDVTVHFGGQAADRVRDRRLLFSPVLHAGRVTWTCVSPDLPHRVLPRWCRH
jgi:hypothetical protein